MEDNLIWDLNLRVSGAIGTAYERSMLRLSKWQSVSQRDGREATDVCVSRELQKGNRR